MAPQLPDRSQVAATRTRLTRTTKGARSHLAATVALGAFDVALIIAQATLLASVIADAFIDGASLDDVKTRLILLAALALGRGLVAAGFEISGRTGASRVMQELRGRLVSHLLRERPGALAGERRGEVASTAVQGVDALEAYFSRYMPQVALSVLAPVAILAWAFPRDFESAAILAVTFPLIPVFMILVGKLAERSVRARWGTLSRLSSHFLDVVGGLATLRAHGRAEAQAETIERAGERYRSETIKTLRVGFLSALVLELLAMLGTALVAATIGVQLVAGDLGFEAGLTILLLAPELYLPLRKAGSEFHASADGMAAAERIFEVLDTPPALSVPAHPKRCPDPSIEPVLLREVTFSHPDAPEPVLRDVSLRIDPGESLALVGSSGCGKTTLASLVLRLADPDSGGILCGGVDLREVDPREWHRQIAWLPQRPTIFTATVADNVRLADPGASIERVEAAVRAANAAEVVASLPDGLDTVIGEGGRPLSFGQSQRIALARAFLSDAPFVVLDEPTAHLDEESEAAVIEAIGRLTASRTALFIAHRSGLVDGVDRVVELSEGRAAEIAARPAVAR